MPRWLLATDGSPSALRAAAYTAALAQHVPDLQLTLLAIQDDPVRDLAIAGDASVLALSVNRRLERGSPRQRICEVAKEDGCDLVIIGSRGLGEIEGLLLGSVSHYVSQNAPCPGLLVR